MKAVDITPHMRKGENLIALRLVVTNPTDGLLDLLKLTGDFSLAPQGDGTYRIEAPLHISSTSALDRSRLSSFLRPGGLPKAL